MTDLPHVTVVIADCHNYGKAIAAIQKTLENIKPAETIFFTDIPYPSDQFRVEQIKSLKSAKDYSRWMIKELGKYKFTTSHLLIIQHDGYVLDDQAWTDEFLEVDYIGAKWLERDGYNVGNGGFSLRSVNLHSIIAEDDVIKGLQPEDSYLCRVYRDYLEQVYSIKFAPDELADRFSFELCQPKQSTFGFHGWHHESYKPYVVLQRLGAFGDVVQMEPVMQWYHDHGYNVVVDTPFWDLFGRHRFRVWNYQNFDKSIPHKLINLDMAYEVNPAQLHLKSYFDICGIDTPILKAPQLDHFVNKGARIFQKYVVIHTDTRETTHRNVHGIDWDLVRTAIEQLGYTPIQVGTGDHEIAGIHFNTSNMTSLLMWLVGGADLFIGVDSGPSHVAVALGRKCILFFGSVKPEYIHADMSNIIVMQENCPIAKDGCWHRTTSTRGVDCEVDVKKPPCTDYDTRKLIDHISKQLTNERI